MQRQVDRVELLARQVGDGLLEECGEDLVVDLPGRGGGRAAEDGDVPVRMLRLELDDRAKLAFLRRPVQRLLSSVPFPPLECGAVGERRAEGVALVPEAGDGEATAGFDHWRGS